MAEGSEGVENRCVEEGLRERAGWGWEDVNHLGTVDGTADREGRWQTGQMARQTGLMARNRADGTADRAHGTADRADDTTDRADGR